MFQRDTTARTPAEYSWGSSSSYAVNAPPEFSRRSGWMNGIGIPARTPGTTHHSRLLFCVVLKHVLLPLRVAPPAHLRTKDKRGRPPSDTEPSELPPVCAHVFSGILLWCGVRSAPRASADILTLQSR